MIALRTLLLALLLPLLWGCGASASSDVQQVVRYGGYAVRAADNEVAPLYSAAHRAAYNEAENLQGYQQRMDLWNALEAALRLSYSAFVAADQALEAGEQLQLGRVACLLSSLSIVADALRGLDLPVPDVLTRALGFATNFTTECTEEPAHE